MLDRFLDWISRNGGSRMIKRDGKPYLERFYVLKTKPLTIMIHKFWASDPDEPHDHPFNWASLLLRGGYREYGVDGKSVVRYPFSFRFRRAEEFHRIEALPNDFCPGWTTTLFFTGKRRRDWGFLRGDKWIPASEYDRQEVEIQGRDFVVEGIFFPKVRYLKKTGDPLLDWADQVLAEGAALRHSDTDVKFTIEKLIEMVDYVAKLEARVAAVEEDIYNIVGHVEHLYDSVDEQRVEEPW